MRLPEIVIDVNLEYFQFTSNEQQYRIDTYVSLAFENNDPMLVSIGENTELSDAIIVHLLEEEVLDPRLEEVEKFDLFTAFMEYGIGKSFEKSWHAFSKPVIIFRGDKNLQTFFSGYQKFFLEAVALAGGAGEVKFE